MCPDLLQNWLDYGCVFYSCYFSIILTYWNEPSLGFAGISWRMHIKNGPKFWRVFGLVKQVKFRGIEHFQEKYERNGMLIHPDHLQNWFDYGHGMLVFLILAQFWPSESDHIGVSGPFSENAGREWPGYIFKAEACFRGFASSSIYLVMVRQLCCRGVCKMNRDICNCSETKFPSDMDNVERR